MIKSYKKNKKNKKNKNKNYVMTKISNKIK